MSKSLKPLYPNKKYPSPLHDLWTWAVGLPGYDKEKWNALAEQIENLERQRRTSMKPKIGDLVRLKSGGPSMSVTLLNDEKESVFCKWFTTDQQLHESWFAAPSLEVVGTAGLKQ